MLVVAWIHGIYYAASGLWPIVHMRSFLGVTGPKSDLWLVRTVGLLIVVIGGAIALAAWRREIGPATVALAAGTAATLTLVDVLYVARRVIPRIYLLDAIAEVALIVAWTCAALAR